MSRASGPRDEEVPRLAEVLEGALEGRFEQLVAVQRLRFAILLAEHAITSRSTGRALSGTELRAYTHEAAAQQGWAAASVRSGF